MSFLIIICIILLVLCLGFCIYLAIKFNQFSLNQVESQLEQNIQTSKQNQGQLQQFIQTVLINQFKDNRTELQQTITMLQDSLLKQINDYAQLQQSQLDRVIKNISVLSKHNEDRLNTMREAVEKRLTILQDEKKS